MSWYGVITDVGRRLLADYASGSASVNIDKITVGSGYVDESIMRAATDLVSEKDVGSIIKKESVEEGVDFQFQFGPCADGNYVAHEIGMWANSTTENPVLLALFQNDLGAQVPSAEVNPNYVYILNVLLAISNLSSLTVTCYAEAFVPYRVFTPYTEEVAAALDGKVDKIAGKGLSENDYTSAEKTKLAGIEAQANKYVLPTATASTLGGVKIGAGLSAPNGVIQNTGVRSVSTGSTNGTISVNTNGTATDVHVKGLGTSAFTDVGNYAAANHTHDASAINSGTLPVTRGGTGVSSNPSMLVDLSSGNADTVFKSSPKPGVTGTLPVAKGGTGATKASDALTNLGAAAAGHKHAAGDVTSGTLAVERGGTGVTANPSMLTNLGSTNADTVFKTSPRPGVTGTLPVANGGTGATKAADALLNLGAAAAGHKHAAGDITSGTLAIARGGTGLTASPSMLTNLASTSADNVFKASPRPGVTGTLPIANGGTGATTKAAALTSLGAAAVNHTHAFPDILTGAFKSMGIFNGDNSINRLINVGYKPSRVVVIAMAHGYLHGIRYIDLTSNPSMSTYMDRKIIPMLFTATVGDNFVPFSGNAATTENDRKATSEEAINVILNRGNGGLAIVSNGFRIGCPYPGLDGNTYNAMEEVDYLFLLNQNKFTYLWLAWA